MSHPASPVTAGASPAHRPPDGLRRRFRTVAEATVAQRAEECFAAGRLDHESWTDLAAEGVWRLPVPRRWGGFGGTWWEFTAAFEGVAQGGRDLGFTLSMVAQAGLIRTLLRHGSEEQLDLYLPGLLDGAVGATALTETRGGSDVARTETSARRTSSGYELDGQKDHITRGPVADVALVLARVPEAGSRDITLFLVDTATTAGVRRGEVEDMAGNRTSPTGPLGFDHAPLPQHACFGGVGAGLQVIYDTISLDRLLYGVLAAAYLEPIIEESLDFACHRTAFKTAIVNHQYVQGRLTDMRFGVETTRWTAYAALAALIEERPEANMLCSIAKHEGAERLREGTEHAVRILGHAGYVNGPASRRLLDGLGTVIAGGTAEMQRKNVFNQMMRLRSADSNHQQEATPEGRAA
jgi:isovaleryl-CoA dehydrogenase